MGPCICVDTTQLHLHLSVYAAQQEEGYDRTCKVIKPYFGIFVQLFN